MGHTLRTTGLDGGVGPRVWAGLPQRATGCPPSATYLTMDSAILLTVPLSASKEGPRSML